VAGDTAQQDRRFWDEQWVCRKCEGNTIGITTPRSGVPEANGPNQTLPLRVPQVTWSSPVTNSLLLERASAGHYGWGNFERPESDARSDQGHRTVCGRLPREWQSSGIVYRSQDFGDNRTGS
jgi:hypothetical protein